MDDPYNNKFIDVKEEVVPELPEVLDSRSGALPVLANGRDCPTCKVPVRIVSNTAGVSGHCAKCRTSWPLASTPLQPTAPLAPPRGLSKKTIVEPDWSIADDT